MKINIEIDPSITDYEVTIKCSQIDNTVAKLQRMLSESTEQTASIVLYHGETEFYMPLSKILFFETSDGLLMAHTATDAFEVRHKLYELEELLPSYFMRISKSAILNTRKVYAITRNITASSLVEFQGTKKTVYVSRNYYKSLRDRLSPERNES